MIVSLARPSENDDLTSIILPEANVLSSVIILRSTNGKGNCLLMPYIDYGLCVGCGACAEAYPRFFIMRDDKAWFVNHEQFVLEENRGIEYVCPFHAIRIE